MWVFVLAWLRVPMKLYRIENPDGLYSTGGMSPRWTKQGKIWRGGALKLHLRMFTGRYPNDPYVTKWPYDGCFVEELVLTPVGSWNLFQDQRALRLS